MSATTSSTEKYNDLLKEIVRLSSAFTSLRQAIDAGDLSTAGDIAIIFEHHAWGVVEAHPRIEEAK
ncbi:MAG: hypothetical protein AB7S67_14505 [Thiomonas sp.]|jgi:hypothetical protein